ncbi:8-amino-7-oxononanoate synthase [Salinithrix halophila]|uniref:8-amino-7-ketopelargonate synthase n=1 Tax=Salinithrix halophila TaxID=1485204 RepID=A0ABV8JLI7_9BACL
MTDWDRDIRRRLHDLDGQGLLRERRPVSNAAFPVLEREGASLINFSSNNYLGLAGNTKIVQAEGKGAYSGAGATASRLITGTDEGTKMLEKELATYKGTEAALIFGSGYAANLGVLSALLGREDAVFSDRLNHASIVDGIRLSGARCFRYRHGDADHLETLLQKADRQGFRKKLIVTDTVFSMDGDIAPLADLLELKERFGAALMVDDAHGGGVFGPEGKGVVHQLGLGDRVDLHMGTFSKAFGVYGAYVAGRENWIRYLVNTSRSWIYTTALPPAVTAGIAASLQLVRQGEDLRQSLREKSRWFRNELQRAGFDTGPSASQIIPVMVGENRASLRFSQRLADRGVLAVGIRPPTVPKGTARIRFSLMANHRCEDLEQALEAITETGRELGVIA